jgi:hypothetical protein
MAKVKFSLDAAPTFKAPVPIPIPGRNNPEKIEFTFKFRPRDEFNTWVKALDSRKDPDDEIGVVKDMVTGWELAEPFDDEHLTQLLQNYPGAAQAISETYITEQTGQKHRLGNFVR